VSEPVRLICLPHPFSLADRRIVELPFEKASLAALAERENMTEGHVLALVGGTEVPRAWWPHLAPKPGVEIILRRVPTGGGGNKNPLATVLSIASFFVPLAWGPAVAGLTGVGWYGVLAKGALFLLSSALSRPSTQRLGSSAQAQDPTAYRVTGGSNKVTPYGVVPRVYGRIRVFPPYAAQPYTELAGGKQYLNLLFDFGYGPLKFEDFRIGATPLANFSGVEMEVRPGYSTDAPMTLYRNDVAPQALSILVKQSTGQRVIVTTQDADEATLDFVFQSGLVTYDEEEGTRLQRTARYQVDYRVAGSGGAWLDAGVQGNAPVASTAATLIGSSATSKTYRTDLATIGKIDLKLQVDAGDEWRISTRSYGATSWVQQATVLSYEEYWGEYYGTQIIDKTGPRTVNLVVTPSARTEVLIEQAPWTPAAKAPTILSVNYHYIDAGTYDFTASQGTPYMCGARILFPARGQYEVRVQRVTADTAVDTIRDELTWVGLNGITYRPPVAVSGHALIALRIQATEQLNGIVQELSAVCTALLKTWDGSAWTDYVETRNPAWAYADILCGTANARALDRGRLDVNAIKAWADDCDTAGRQFNAVIDFRTTVFELARDVASVGRASFHMRDGLYSVVQDKAQTAPRQHFTPRNSWGFSGEKRFVDMPHGIKCRFLNRDKDWQQDERIVYDDGYSDANATRFEVLELFGVDNADQAWQDGRFRIACARLRPEEYRLYADVEHIVCNRGDLVKVSHDVPLWGQGYGRLKTVTLNGSSEATAATLDAQIVMESGKSYVLRIRKATGASVLAAIATVAGGQTAVTFPTPIPAAAAPAAGDLFLFGELGAESADLLVVSIEPRSDLSALIRLVDAAPAVHLADQGAIPPFDSQISLPATWRRAPAIPVFVRVASDEEAIILTPDGGYLNAMQATLTIPSGGAVPATNVQVRWRQSGETSWSAAANYPAASPIVVTISDVQQGVTYEISARSLGAVGETSDYTSTTHTVVGPTAVPPDCSSLLMRNQSLIWSHAQPRDHAGYRVRFHAGTTRDWTSAAAAHIGLITAAPFDVSGLTSGGGTMTFMVKAADLAGNESANAVALTANLGDAIVSNVLLQHDFHPAFAGTIENGSVVAGVLEADDTGGLFWGSGTAKFYGGAAGLFWQASYLELRYTATLTPTSAESGPGRILLDSMIAGNGYKLEWKSTGSQNQFWSGGGDFWGAAANAFWTDSPDWSPWPGEVSPIPNIELQFRATAYAGIRQGAISAFSIVLDVPDVIEELEDAAISSAGTTRLPITKTFRAIKSVKLTLQDIATGAIGVKAFDKDEVNGPLVKAYDATGALVDASVDATVQGY
jgi:predicted phage tail protein